MVDLAGSSPPSKRRVGGRMELSPPREKRRSVQSFLANGGRIGVRCVRGRPLLARDHRAGKDFWTTEEGRKKIREIVGGMDLNVEIERAEEDCGLEEYF